LLKWRQREEGEEGKIMTSAHGQDRNDGGKTGGSTQGQIFACIQKTLRKKGKEKRTDDP